MFPATTVVPEGVAVSVKSAKKIVKEIAAVCPAEVPVAVKFRGFAEVAESPETVRVLDCPGRTDAGLNAQVAELLQDSAMVPPTVLDAATEIVKVAVFEPMGITLDRAFDDREKDGVPVPERLTTTFDCTAVEVMLMDPLTFPVVLGVNEIEIVHACPTFRTVGVVGKFPQVLVSAKLPPEVILVRVTAWLPLLISRTV